MTEQEKQYFQLLTERRTKIADALDDPSVRGVKGSVVDKYSDQAHFIYELIQNADDALATEAVFEVFDDRMVFTHNGTRRFTVTNPITEGEDFDNHCVGDINAITAIGLSTKTEANRKGNAIGKFGMGFKSIFQYTSTPEIYDPNIAFKIERQLVPILLDHDYPGRKKEDTVFVFPFNNVHAKRPVLDCQEKLDSLLFPTLFLNNLHVIKFSYKSTVGEYLKKIVKASNFEEDRKTVTCEHIVLSKTSTAGSEKCEMLLFTRSDDEHHRYAVGFVLGDDGKPVPSDYRAFCFFPTKHETKLKFLIHAPFLLTDSRETIKEFEDHNTDMVSKLAVLTCDSLLHMRDMRTSVGERLIDDGILDVIPTTNCGDLDEFFKPFWYRIRFCLMMERILPTVDDYVNAQVAYWPTSKQMPVIFPDKLLQSLYDNSDVHWVFLTKWNDYDLDGNLSSYIKGCVKESPTESAVLDHITPEFVESQSLEWLSDFYKWIDESVDRRRKARKLPIFLNRNMKAVAAFDKNDQPILFMPAPGSDDFETINERLLEDSNVMELVNCYKLSAPSQVDLIKYIIDNKLPNARDDKDDIYLKQVVDYYISLPQVEKNQLVDKMFGKVLLRGYDNNTREIKRLHSTALYFPDDFVREYFEGMGDVNMLDVEYYHELLDKRVWEDFDSLLKAIGVAVMPVKAFSELSILELTLFRLNTFCKSMEFGVPAEAHRHAQRYYVSYVQGIELILGRLEEVSDTNAKRRLSLMIWRVLRYHATDFYIKTQGHFDGKLYSLYRNDGLDLFGHWVTSFVGRCRPNFLSSLHSYSRYGMNYEGFDSPQLCALRGAKWIVLDDGSCVSPGDLPINRLPSAYEHGSVDEHLITALCFREEEVTEVECDNEAGSAKHRAEAEARERLSEEQLSSLTMGEKARRLGLTDEDLEYAAKEKEKRRRAETMAAAVGMVSINDCSVVEDAVAQGGASHVSQNNLRQDGVESEPEGEGVHLIDPLKGGVQALATDAGAVSGIANRHVHVDERKRVCPVRGVLGNIAERVDAISSAYKNNVPPPPLPELDDGELDDDDELTPKSLDFEARIRSREQKQAMEIAELERGEELQKQVKSHERYTFGWFKSLLDLELLGKEKDGSEQREISLSFTKMEHEPGTDRTYVLKHPSRNIPQWIEDLSGIPLDLYVGGKTIRLVIEGMSVQSYTLRIKLKTDTKFEGVDLARLVEAKITATRPAFLLEELRRGMSALPYDDMKNLRDDLTENIEFIFGPPGTGKTTFLARNRIVPLMRNGKDYKVLVLAPTNKAADVLTSRIISVLDGDKSYKQWLVRFGSTMDEVLDRLGVCPGKDVDLKCFPRHVVISTIARFPYDFCITGNSAPQKLIDQEWDYIVIDEASMIALASIIYALYSKPDAKFIIAGDPFQIEPIISCDIWKDENIYTMVGLKDFGNPATVPHNYQVKKLTTQYRSIPAVGRIFSKYRYGGILQHSRNASSQRELKIEGMPKFRPLTLLKFPVSPYESVYRLKRLGKNGGSSYQVYSALFAFELVNAIAHKIGSVEPLFRIGVISPYRAQADIVQKLLESIKFPDNVSVSSGTVHGFQGDECEMIIALFNPPPGISSHKGSFINKKNIINVAISRARDYLVLLMPDDHTHNLGNMIEVRKIERLMRDDPDNCIIHDAAEVEEAIFGSPTFIEDNAFSTGHQSVNVYGVPEMRYEVRSEEFAVDVQIQHDVVTKGEGRK